MSAHLFGYFDALLYVLAITSVALTLSDRPFLAAIVSVAAILTHESFLLIGWPLVCLASIALLSSQGRRGRWAVHTTANLFPLIAFVAIVAFQSLTVDKMVLRQQLTAYLNSFGFVSGSRGVAIWETTSFSEFLRQEGASFGGRLLTPVTVASVGPSVLALLYFVHASFRVRFYSVFSTALLGAVCLPLAMHAAAWDTARISTYTIGGAFIASWIVAEMRRPQIGGDLLPLLALPALLLNIFGRLPLMDNETDRFSSMTRLLLYSPTLALALTIVVKGYASTFLVDFCRDGIPKNAVDSHKR